ncbi:MAG: Txe/YoeB family addiction module toxin [Selenomonadaceae bacterium]|nr:Txe/YoeB family addiction module toxin [Selenomonadaceae bacterium]
MNKIFSDKGFEDYVYWQTQDRKTLKRINDLIKDIERNGVDKGIGKPEQLKHELSGMWSRHIDEKNRIIYFLDDNNCLNIASCKGHYN